MACISERRGKLVLDYRDQWGRRHWVTFPLTEEGRSAAEDELRRVETGKGSGVDHATTLGRYITDHWAPIMRTRLDVRSAVAYELNARLHIPETMKKLRVHEVTRAHVKRFLATLGTEHDLAEATVGKVANVIRSILECAVDDGLIPANPAAALRLARGTDTASADLVRAMDGSQFDAFMATARISEPETFPMFAVLVYAGLRIGELRGLQVPDLDLTAKTLRVERQVFDDGAVGPVKGKRGRKRPRTVDVSQELSEVLEPWMAARRAYTMRTGSRSPWLLLPDWPVEPLSADASATTHRIRRAMQRILKAAKLPNHFTPHSLRHTYCRLLLERGEDLLYVSRQLGNTLSMASDRYGHFARVKPRAGGADLLGRQKG